jgi:hypothetical protein
MNILCISDLFGFVVDARSLSKTPMAGDGQ